MGVAGPCGTSPARFVERACSSEHALLHYNSPTLRAFEARLVACSCDSWFVSVFVWSMVIVNLKTPSVRSECDALYNDVSDMCLSNVWTWL